MISRRHGAFLVVSGLCLSWCAAADSPPLPWTFNAPRGEGYAIDLVDVNPAPGTPLSVGETVDFKVTVKYTLSVASHGTIVLVFEDENNKNAEPKGPQVAWNVNSPSGEVTLQDQVAVPSHAKELRLFIPLVPDGMAHTTGEIAVRYPIH